MRTNLRFYINILIPTLFLIFLISCGSKKNQSNNETANEQKKYQVIFDTDANNELDDQHALAYLLFNSDVFNTLGVTVNATFADTTIQGHYDEALRILTLCKSEKTIPLFKGAEKNFLEIRKDIHKDKFDGSDAVNFIINTAKKATKPLVLIPVGKLTNIALALEKDPSIMSKVRVVWLGSNYPLPGEYNQVNDTAAMSYVLHTNVPFEMVTVRYGKETGTAAVKVSQEEINAKMPGLGPQLPKNIIGRHGDSFNNFGDYSVNLFKHINYHSEERTRSLFDMVAVAIIKNPDWGEATEISCPALIDSKWVEQPDNPRKIIIWENFNKEALINDFFHSMRNFKLPEQSN